MHSLKSGMLKILNFKISNSDSISVIQNTPKYEVSRISGCNKCYLSEFKDLYRYTMLHYASNC